MPTFLIDENLGLRPSEAPWCDFFPRVGITTSCTTDLPALDRSVAAHEPDIVFMPIADFHRLLRTGDRRYRGFAIVTSKFTRATQLPSALVVRSDDPAACLADLAGASFGYINCSCTSSYYALAILLQQIGHTLDFVTMTQTRPWQGQIDAVTAGEVRATVVLEDVWKTTPANADTTKIIGRYDDATGALIVVRDGLDSSLLRTLLDVLVGWQPTGQAVYGGFQPFAESDVARFFADLDKLPATL